MDKSRHDDDVSGLRRYHRPMPMPSVLFVCLGNICRSPLAEAALRLEASRAGLDLLIDSAGTGSWHIGNPPDPRARAEALRHGVDMSAYQARQVTADDFDRFDRIFALDRQNMRDLEKLRRNGAQARLSLLLDLVPGMAGSSVNDPYYGGPEDFAETWGQVSLAARHLIAEFSKA